MSKKILFIVESPGKIKKINSILGNGYLVKASVGHVRDLESSGLGIDLENNFKPSYVISKDKKKVVADLKSCLSKCSDVILAADEDREGEAIAASLADVLKLKNPKRIVFNEITSSAIKNALKSPREINYNLVRAQETRRFLDRIVGYKISPVLWNNIALNLSAGRVQSVVVKIIIEKEKEIAKLDQNAYFKIYGSFISKKNSENKLNAVLYEKEGRSVLKLTKKENVEKILKILDKSSYSVKLIENKVSERNPSPPFITSTLQQEASNKLGLNIKATMTAAQKLYEAGYITYMRTDSTNLSNEALGSCKKFIISKYGSEYHKFRNYSSKSKNAQEAHEAIRPTHIENMDVNGSDLEKKLYKLIWKRTVASQMSAARVSINNIYVDIRHNKKLPYYFMATNESIIFEGYLKVYNLKSDDDELQKANTNFTKDEELLYEEIEGKEEYPKSIGRYNEASLVKKLEDLGIGRPSTYASIITKIQERNYVDKVDLKGEEKEVSIAKMKRNIGIKWSKSKTTLGKEKQKLIPTEIGVKVTKFLESNFDNIMDLKFTANLENELDEIVDGRKIWTNILRSFWNGLSPKVEGLLKEKNVRSQNDRLLGKCPNSNGDICVSISKYGPVVKLINGNDIKYASINKPLKMDTITLTEAVGLLSYPKPLGNHNGKEVILNKGKYGYYLTYDGKNFQVSNEKVTLSDAVQIIEVKNKDILNEFDINGKKYQIRNGKYGPYISYNLGKKLKFVSIPKSKVIDKITDRDITNLIDGNKK